MSERKIHVTETATALNLTPVMPVGQRIYITVRAVNRAGTVCFVFFLRHNEFVYKEEALKLVLLI